MIISKIVNAIPWSVRGRIKDIPGLKQLQAVLFEKCFSGKHFDHEINAGPAKGLVYPVELPQDKSIWIGNYEQEFSEALASAVKPGAVCFDIGGFRGFFSGVMACQGASEVHVFEPLPENVDQIKKMSSSNPSLPITVHQLALADSNGESEFHVMPESSMGKIGASTFETGDSSESSIPVQLATIDSLIQNRSVSPANLLKIDVEGAEVLVLKGAEKFISDHRPVIFVEAHSRELAQKCLSILQPFDYKFTVLESGAAPDFESDPEVCHIECTPV